MCEQYNKNDNAGFNNVTKVTSRCQQCNENDNAGFNNVTKVTMQVSTT